MKRIIVLTLAIVCLLGLCGCNSNNADSPAEHEAVSADYGKVIPNRKPRFIHMNLSRLLSRVVTSIPLTVTQQRRKVQRAAIVRVLFTRCQRMENLQCFGTV